MARLGRYFLPEYPLHIIQRGNNRGPIFFADDDYGRYREWLRAAAAEHGLAIHAYVLMTNHMHLLATPARTDSVPRALQSLGRRYVRYINTTYRRTGTLWEGRYRATPIDSDRYLLECCRYIELNPVRARMVNAPGDYRWSSHRALAGEAGDPLVTPHALYDCLGADRAQRQAAYRELFALALDTEFIDDLRRATQGGWALGDADFKRRIAETLGRRVEKLPRGRPRKGVAPELQENLL